MFLFAPARLETIRIAALAALLAFLPASGVAGAAAPPKRIVSLNLCLDQLLVELAEPERIAALTSLSRDRTISPIADIAATLPVQYGSVEDILRYAPDLVLANSYTRRSTVRLLKRLGVPVAEFAPAVTFEQIRRNITQLAGVLGVAGRGERLIADFNARLAALRPPPDAAPIIAAPYYASNFTSGSGTLVDAALKAAGLQNLVVQLGKSDTARLPLEMLVYSRPELIVLSHRRSGYRTYSSANLSHPALAELLRGTASVSVPERLWLCGTPVIAEAVALLAGARTKIAARKPPR